MAEMKNPQQQIGGLSLRVVFSMALILVVAMFMQQSLKHKVDVESNIKPSIRVDQPNGIEGEAATPAHVVAKMRPSAPHAELLDILARPLFEALNWTHLHVISNWGWAILVLTLLINVVLLPLRIRMMRSHLKTQRIQPEMAAIKERFKGCKLGDPRMQAMNQEVSDLQRSQGISMVGNILPLLIQMPLLYAFYRMLHNAVELKHAPWLWLHDLSVADPLHILPIIFVVTMVLQQWVTPAPGTDAAQRKMMAVVMPLLYGVMTWHVSAGLALYWSGGNIFAIVQQIVFSRSRLTV